MSRTRWSAPIASRGGQWSLLVAASTAALYARTLMGPLQETMRSALSLSDNQMALLQGPALAILPVLAAAPIGLLIDRSSRVRLVAILAWTEVLGSAMTASAPNFAVLCLARSLVGLASGATITAAFSLLGDLYEPTRRGRAAMGIVIGQVVGMSIVFALGGALLGVTPSYHEHWRIVAFELVGPLLIVAALLGALREPSRGSTACRRSVTGSLRLLWRNRARIAPAALGITLMEMGAGAALVWTAPLLTRKFALPPARVGAAIGAGLLISGVLGPLVGGCLADVGQRFGGPPRTMQLLGGIALLSAIAGWHLNASQGVWASAIFVVYLTTVGAAAVIGVTLFTITVPEEVRGLSLSLLAGASALFGFGLAPPLVSLLAGTLGRSATFGAAPRALGTALGAALSAVCLSAGLVAALSFTFGSRPLSRLAYGKG